MPLDRLSVLDASFLQLETPTTHLHLGGLGIMEPGLAYATVVRVLRERLDAVPLARKRIAPAPPGAGRPVWVDDPDFDLSYHVRHAALPGPGDRGQLAEFVARLLGRPLDRFRPLWELYVIEGLEGDRVALFRKVHLAMAGDGSDPFGVLLDDAPRDLDAEEGRGAIPWHAARPPGALQLAADALAERAGRTAELGRAVGEAALAPHRAIGAAREAAAAAAGLAGRVLRTAPRSPLNRRLSPHRRFATAQIDLADLRAVRTAFGGTINDAVVAVTADAVGRLLRWRGHETKDLDLRVLVPVKVQPDQSTDGVPPTPVGEGVVGVLAPLPVMRMDPVARLYRIMGELAGLKDSRQAVAADQLARVAGYAPAALHALAARLVSGHQRYNLALSNAPGPQEPRYLAGAALEETYPFIPLVGDAALSVAVSSYAGRLYFGLQGDRDALFDLDVLAELITDAAADLLAAAASQRAKGSA